MDLNPRDIEFMS